MKTKHFLLSLLALLVSVSASAYDAKIDGIYYNFSDGKAIVTYREYSYKSYSGSVVIPDSVTHNGTTYSVTSIGYCAFYKCSGLTSVIIGNSVTSIGYSAFEGCSSLISVIIPNSVTSIGDYAFRGCSDLTSVTIPNSVTSIGNYAFSGCYLVGTSFINNSTLTSDNNWGTTLVDEETSDGLLIKDNIVKICRSWATSVTIPEGVTSISDYAFYERSGLTSVIIGNGVTSIGNYAFRGCSGLTSVTIPNSVTSIGYQAFRGCSGLTSVTIPNSVTSIGNDAFYECSGLTSVIIGNGVTSIGNYAFSGCSGLTSVTIPNSVTSIGSDAFSGCSGLTSVIIGNGVTSIGDAAFFGCSNLTSVTIPERVTSIGRNAFEGTAWYKNQPDGLVYAGKVAYKYKGTMPEGTEIVIKDGTLGIAGSAFSNCSGLTSVTIPNSVTSIGDDAFEYCSGLTSVTIPSSVTSIGYGAFESCSGLTSINISNSVTSIGSSAFEGCSGLTSVTIPESVTSIGNYAFSGCSGLTSINIPNSVTSIGGYAFSGCSGLTSVTIPESVTSIGWYAFERCSGLTSVTIPESVTSIDNSAFSGCSGLTSVTIPNSVTSIGSSAFKYCRGLTDVWCYAENVPNTNSNAFGSSTIDSATLHVPAGSVNAYSTTAPWSGFGTIAPIYDEESSKPFPAGTYAKADLKRTFEEGWNTICLPFAVGDIEAAFGTGAKAYGFDDFADGELKFSQVTWLAAGTPYVIYVPAEITDLIAFENIVVEESNTTGYSIYTSGVFFRGTYAPIAAGGWTKANSTDDIYGLTADGRIRKAGTEASILGFRGYFDIPAGAEVKGFVFGGDATGIDDIDHSPLTIDHSIYNLAGQRLNKAQKGINIINGKKILK